MNTTINIIAQNAMDLYYQQDRSAEDFLEFYHFRFMSSAVYATMLQEEFRLSKRENLQETGQSSAQLNPDWFISEVVGLKHDPATGDYIAKLSNKVFSFRYDNQSSGIQLIESPNGKGDFIRTRVVERWKRSLMPTTSIVQWFIQNDELRLLTSNGLGKIHVSYIPAISDDEDIDTPIHLSMAETIIRAVLALFKEAKQGTVVDMRNDQNPNSNIETQILEYLKKAQNG